VLCYAVLCCAVLCGWLRPRLTEAARQGALATGLPLCWGHESDSLHSALAPLGAEDSGRTALYGAFLAEVPAMYW
jgi:hypothetical protein